MDLAGRELAPAVLQALNGDRGAVLLPFFNGLLSELPWWDSAWRVLHLEPPYKTEYASDEGRGKNRFTEVSVPGSVGDGDGWSLPFFGAVRFEGDRLLRFQAKIGDMVIGPALAEPGRREPHPFGAVLSALMTNRGVTRQELARRTQRAEATIAGQMRGGRNPHPVREIARALDIPEADLIAIAGVTE